MTRVKCRKCTNVYEQSLAGAALAPHVDHYITLMSSLGKEEAMSTHPLKTQLLAARSKTKNKLQPELSEEELENKRIE
jgi:hypothetical protein